MAKSTPKAAPKAVKKAPAKKAKASPDKLILKVCETSLGKLNDLNIEHALQSEINWCIGSYHNDHNPIGLYQMAERSLIVFTAELEKKSKGITPAFIKEIEKAIKAR